MKTRKLVTIGAGLGLLSVLASLPVHDVVHAQGNTSKEFVAPMVFQAAGPTAASIQSSVDQYREALGQPDNRNAGAQPSGSGHREINWDGGSPTNQNTVV